MSDGSISASPGASPRPSDVDAAIRRISSPHQPSDDALTDGLSTLGRAAQGAVAAIPKGEEPPGWVAQLAERLCGERLLGRVCGSFIDGGNRGRQESAAKVLNLLGECRPMPYTTKELISAVGGSPQTFISSVARVLDEANLNQASFTVENAAFALLADSMVKGRHEGNAVDTRDHLVHRHPGVFERAIESLEKIAEDNERGTMAMAFLISAFCTPRHIPWPAFPWAPMPTFIWVPCFDNNMAKEILSHCCHYIRCLGDKGSDSDRAECLKALQKHICPLIDTLAATLTSPDADEGVRRGAARSVENIFFLGKAFTRATGMGHFASLPNGPAQRFMGVPGALDAYTAISAYARTASFLFSLPSRISTESQGLADFADTLVSIVGAATDLTDERARIAVRDGLPTALCEMAFCLIKGGQVDQQKVDRFVNVAVGSLSALVSYGDHVSSRGGKSRPNSVTQAILQHESVKTRRAAARQPGRRKGHQQLIVPKELLEFFDEIERAANERADSLLAAELADDHIDEGKKDTNTSSSSGSRGGKKRSKGKRGGRGANATKTTDTNETASSSSIGADNIDVDPKEHEHEEDTEDHHGLPGPASPSPPSPPRPSCSSFSSASAAAAAGSGQQVRAVDGGGGVEGGGFVTVGRRKKGKGSTEPTSGGEAQQQQTKRTDIPHDRSNTSVLPSSSESTRPSSSRSSVRGDPGNAPPLPFHLPPRPPRPAPPVPSHMATNGAPGGYGDAPVRRGAGRGLGVPILPPPHEMQQPSFPIAGIATPKASSAASPSSAACATGVASSSSSGVGSDGHGFAPLAGISSGSSSGLQRAADDEGGGGQGRCGGEEVSELETLRQQLEAMRVERDAIKREKDRLEESTECDICMADKRCVVLVPCRHFCLCGACAAALMSRPVDQRLCPRCRQKITATKHVYT
ncbi:unnamed protein product [Vitrella brassicaformis CCMP3155]|uniref:RING-type domain-containing protein n=1 Tax=Vitrella brassicaformis (strain CCMP3155) TaxID=1169540 RepID=A0A0G4FNH8_VITBC|nr:unnamed protein product [Vitrella brassicaformis CCMP3155]|eukprot:CEM15581.1 unnamed protein product [Vitrella brassicaformis CCMP3155]